MVTDRENLSINTNSAVVEEVGKIMGKRSEPSNVDEESLASWGHQQKDQK